jgi:hypothetical protein
LHHVDDGAHIFVFFLFRVGVVEPQVAGAAVVAREAEVQADALGMADVQIAVGLGGKRVRMRAASGSPCACTDAGPGWPAQRFSA